MSKIVIWNESGLPDEDAVRFAAEVMSVGRVKGRYQPTTVFDDGYEVVSKSSERVDHFMVLKPKIERSAVMGRPARDFTGYKSGKLTVIKQVEGRSDGRCVWLCSCECGGSKRVNSASLRTRSVMSCGCLPKGRKPRGLADSTKGMEQDKA